MSNFSASIPVALVDAANLHLAGMGFGPNNFSVPASADGQYATHAGFHCWPNVPFRAALAAMVTSGNWPGLTITDGSGTPNFAAHCQSKTLTWVQQQDTWTQNPIMKDDQRTIDGKLWKSLLDYNVWKPPVGWREVVAVGYPAWVQPTGAQDAYKIGDRVSFNGKNYESKIAANVWSPDAYPAGWNVL
jgi:hypothetical protein